MSGAPTGGPIRLAGLSVAVIARDEGHQIAECLGTVRWADELVVLDTGSRDDTRERAREAGAVVEEAPWRGFGTARQEVERHTSRAWVLRLDADERVTPELAEALRTAVARDDRSRIFHVCQLNWCFGRFIRHGGWYPKWVERLYAPGAARWNDATVHEALVPAEGVTRERLPGHLLHYSYRSLREYLEKSALTAEGWAEDRRKTGRRASLSQGIGHGLATFFKMYFLRAGLLDGRAGLLLALLSAHSTFAKYADLWLRDQPEPPPPPPPPPANAR